MAKLRKVVEKKQMVRAIKNMKFRDEKVGDKKNRGEECYLLTACAILGSVYVSGSE